MKEHLKKYKKIYILGIVGVFAVVGLGLTWLNCPEAQFKRYCEGDICVYAQKHMNAEEKKNFVTITKYLKKTGKQTLDDGILKYISKEQIIDIGLKMKVASADAARQLFFDQMVSRDKFQGNYDCMRQVYMNELSNEEVLFLQSLQNKNLNVVLQNPNVRQSYLMVTSKLMKCMNENIQKQYLEEVKMLTTPSTKDEKKSETEGKNEAKKK